MKKKKDKYKTTEIYSHLTKSDMIEIHTEAYYYALKKIEQDKMSNNIQTSDKVSKKDVVNILLQLLLRPKHIKKDKMADGLMMIITTMILSGIGYTLRVIFGLGMIIYPFFKYSNQNLLINITGYIGYILLGLSFILYGGIFLAASKELERNRDTKYLLTYSSSFMGILAVIIALIALFK